MQTELLTERLRLFALGRDDLEALRELLHDEDVRRYLCDGEMLTDEQLSGFVGARMAAFSAGRPGLWGVALRETTTTTLSTSTMCGLVGFAEFYDPPRTELIFALRPSVWGHGYAIESARAAIECARSSFDMDVIHASTDEPNKASIRVLERLGFELSSTSAGKPGLWPQRHYALTG